VLFKIGIGYLLMWLLWTLLVLYSRSQFITFYVFRHYVLISDKLLVVGIEFLL